jgi:hypothetical protein
VPCPHGSCLVWDGWEKFYAGQAWLQYLIDHFCVARPRAQTGGDWQFSEFSFDHEMNGVIVGEQQDSRELVLWVEQSEVTEQVLRCGDPVLPWERGYRGGLDDRPWLAGERPWRSSLVLPPPDLDVAPTPEVRRRRSQGREA